MLIALIGAHGAGKTTLGRALARSLGWVFHEEIGRELAAQEAARPRGRTAADAQPAFDRMVFERELERDAQWDPWRPRIVETWHPGNLAFASIRSPQVVAEVFGRVRARCADERVLVLSLHARADVLRTRCTEAAEPAFFLDVARRARAFCHELGLDRVLPLRTDVASPEHLVARVVDPIRQEMNR